MNFNAARDNGLKLGKPIGLMFNPTFEVLSTGTICHKVFLPRIPTVLKEISTKSTIAYYKLCSVLTCGMTSITED